MFYRYLSSLVIKIHFLGSHLDYLPDNCVDYSEKEKSDLIRIFGNG